MRVVQLVGSFGSQNKIVLTANRVMGPREDVYMESYASCLCNGDFMECIGYFQCRGLLLTALQNMPPVSVCGSKIMVSVPGACHHGTAKNSICITALCRLDSWLKLHLQAQ